MIKFDTYNREERAISAHLFRLLHERLEEKATSPFGQLMSVLSKSSLTFANGKATMAKLKYENIAIYLEPSIIRDAYQSKRAEKISFLDNLTRIIMKQEGVSECRLYSELPETLKNPKLTHPKQIKQKATSANIPLNAGEIKVYGAMQGMFNAKPNLVITVDNLLLVCEAKFTELFDQAQLTGQKKWRRYGQPCYTRISDLRSHPFTRCSSLAPKRATPTLAGLPLPKLPAKLTAVKTEQELPSRLRLST